MKSAVAHSQEEVFHDVVVVWTAAVRQVTGGENNNGVQALAIVTWREKAAVKSWQSPANRRNNVTALPLTSIRWFLLVPDLRAWSPAGTVWWSACQYDAPALLWAPSSRDVRWRCPPHRPLLNRQPEQLWPRPPVCRLDGAQRARSVNKDGLSPKRRTTETKK